MEQSFIENPPKKNCLHSEEQWRNFYLNVDFSFWGNQLRNHLFNTLCIKFHCTILPFLVQCDTYVHFSILCHYIRHTHNMSYLLVLERTVQCSWTLQFFVMFDMFEVQFWAKMWCSEVFEVRSCCLWPD